MINLRLALGSLPSRPVLVIAPLLAALALGYHYYTVYRSCSEQTTLRQQVMAAVTAAAEAADPHIRLSRSTPFTWSRMRVFRDPAGDRRARDCPLGWGWPASKRDRLAAAGLLTVFGFYADDSLVGFVELSGEEVLFTGTEATFGESDAVFTVTRPQARDAPFILTAAE
jgi:hypothetical protein